MELLTIVHLILIGLEAINLLTTFSIKIKIKLKAKKPIKNLIKAQKNLEAAQKKLELAKKIVDTKNEQK